MYLVCGGCCPENEARRETAPIEIRNVENGRNSLTMGNATNNNTHKANYRKHVEFQCHHQNSQSAS